MHAFRHMFSAISIFGLAATLIAGCDSDTTGPKDEIQRGPAILNVEGDPNGLYWDDAEATLFIADDGGNRLLRWTDKDGFALAQNLTPAPEAGAGLGQLIRTADGTLVVTRFGHGAAGAVVTVSPSGEAKDVPNLAPERRRIGLTVAADGQIYDSWFVRESSGARVGAVGALSLDGTEVAVVTGLTKPVGVLALGENLFISDQDLGQILRAPLANPSEYTVFATVPKPDLIAAGPNGALFVGSGGGDVYRIGENGAAAVFKGGFDTVRGIAYDPTNKRLFVVNHVGHEAEGVTHSIHILPVD